MNEYFFVFYQAAMVLSLLSALFVFVLAWRRRESPGANELAALVVLTSVWTLGFLLETSSDTLERQLFFNNIGYLGSMGVPSAWFIFSLRYTNSRQFKLVSFTPLFVVFFRGNRPHLDQRLAQPDVGETLEPEGFAVTVAADGESGIDLMEKTDPQIVLLNIRMPGLDGYQVLERIREKSSPS